MGKIVDIDEKRPGIVSELICVRCGFRWIGHRPIPTLLKDIECPNGHISFACETGQDLDAIKPAEVVV
ncbi:hypothetical protein LCGC14_0773720 [marine sediment metagenome]|uniref:Uncharacterized protein n=1 Tax=marine sediment metagenome TaxID=412755 RepID=A0A0F9PXS0_9ZZZZ